MAKTTLRNSGVHNEIDLEVIHPSQGEKYSPNLYAFLSSLKSRASLRYQRVFLDAAGTHWLGYYFDGDFTGQRLSTVLCEGARVTTYSFTNLPDLVEVEGFWAKYAAIGRCAIDTDHAMYFVGDATRWHEHEGHRSCQWCNQVRQVKKQHTEVKVTETWANA